MENWYVLFTKPRKETQVIDQLEERGLRAYLPLLPAPRCLLHRSPRPLFPRYLFVQADPGKT